MKKKIFIVIIGLTLCGCKGTLSETGDNSDYPDADKSISESAVSVDYADAGNSVISIISSDDNEIEQIVNSCSNLNASQSIYVNVPETAAVYSYTSFIPTDISMESYYTEFLEMFEYLFPEHGLDENYFIYNSGKYADDGNCIYNEVNEWYDELISGEEGRVNFIYDETWFFDMTEWKSPVCLELGNPIGYGYAVINHGKTVELSNSKVFDADLNSERYPLLEGYDPADWLEYVGTYSPDSTESFRLLDGEIPINEAAAFFEEYINSLPYPDKSNTGTRVIEVDVLKVTEDIYGYYFLTTMEYQGILFDYMRSGTSHSEFNDYTSLGGNAFMLESSGVDIVYGYYRLQTMESVSSYDSIISFEEAISKISEKLSDNVEFEVQRIDFVYTQKPNKTSEGYIDIENYSAIVEPAWKFTLYNPNDSLTYVCYVDAKDGENFRYYKTPDSMKLGD